MNMILLNSLMVLLLISNGFFAGSLVSAFIARNLYKQVVLKEFRAKDKIIRNQKALIKQMQEKGEVKVEVVNPNADLDFPKG